MLITIGLVTAVGFVLGLMFVWPVLFVLLPLALIAIVASLQIQGFPIVDIVLVTIAANFAMQIAFVIGNAVAVLYGARGVGMRMQR